MIHIIESKKKERRWWGIKSVHLRLRASLPQQSTITKENQIDRNNNQHPQGFNGIGSKMNRGKVKLPHLSASRLARNYEHEKRQSEMLCLPTI